MPDGVTTGPLTLIGCEQGGPKLEKRRHRQFTAAHVTGEWYTPTPALMEHINSLHARSKVEADVRAANMLYASNRETTS